MADPDRSEDGPPPEAAPAEQAERPTVVRRLVCVAVDGAIVGAVLWGVWEAYLMRGPFLGWFSGIGTALAAAHVICLTAVVGYLTLCHGLAGQSVGKRFGGAKVVRADGSRVGLGRAFVRGVVLLGPWLLLPLATWSANAIVQNAFQLVVVAWSAVLHPVVLLRDGARHRGLHDRAAGTRVVRLRAGP